MEKTGTLECQHALCYMTFILRPYEVCHACYRQYAERYNFSSGVNINNHELFTDLPRPGR